jgi:hypothetical protein
MTSLPSLVVFIVLEQYKLQGSAVDHCFFLLLVPLLPLDTAIECIAWITIE